MEFEIRMNENSIYTMYRNGIPIAHFNTALEHTAAKEIENLLNESKFVSLKHTILSDIKKLKNELDKYDKYGKT